MKRSTATFGTGCKRKYSRTSLIRALVIRMANYPHRLGLAAKFVENSTKVTYRVSDQVLHIRMAFRTSNQPWSKGLDEGKKVKESRNRPGVAQRVPGGLGSQIFMTFGTSRWWGCQPHKPAAFIPSKSSWSSFSLRNESIQGHGMVGKNMSLKNPVTPPGIDPGTVRLVAQRLNHYATPGPFRRRYVL